MNSGGRRRYLIGYPYKDDFYKSCPSKSGGLRIYPSGYLYIRFLLIVTREVKWQADIPKWLSAHTHLLFVRLRVQAHAETNIVICT